MEDVLILRVDASGASLWQRTLGESGRDRAWAATPDGEGGIVVAGERGRTGSEDRDAFAICIGDDGRTRWSRVIESPGDQRVFQVARTDEGTFLLAGTTAAVGQAARDVYVVSLDAAGRPLRTWSFGGEPDDVGHGVLALPAGGALVTGYGATYSAGDNDVYLLRLDRNGEVAWWRHGRNPGDDRAMMSAPSPGGGFVTVGYVFTPMGPDIVVSESDAAGNPRSRTVLERPGSDRGVMILVARDGRAVVAGTVGGSSPSTGDFAVLWLPE
jgi:hypothetical protein